MYEKSNKKRKFPTGNYYDQDFTKGALADPKEEIERLHGIIEDFKEEIKDCQSGERTNTIELRQRMIESSMGDGTLSAEQIAQKAEVLVDYILNGPLTPSLAKIREFIQDGLVSHSSSSGSESYRACLEDLAKNFGIDLSGPSEA